MTSRRSAAAGEGAWLGVAVAGDGAAEPEPDGPQAPSSKATVLPTKTLADHSLMPLKRYPRRGVTASRVEAPGDWQVTVDQADL